MTLDSSICWHSSPTADSGRILWTIYVSVNPTCSSLKLEKCMANKNKCPSGKIDGAYIYRKLNFYIKCTTYIILNFILANFHTKCTKWWYISAFLTEEAILGLISKDIFVEKIYIHICIYLFTKRNYWYHVKKKPLMSIEQIYRMDQNTDTLRLDSNTFPIF